MMIETMKDIINYFETLGLYCRVFTQQEVEDITGFICPVLEPYAAGRTILVDRETKKVVEQPNVYLESRPPVFLNNITVFIDAKVAKDLGYEVKKCFSFCKEDLQEVSLVFIGNSIPQTEGVIVNGDRHWGNRIYPLFQRMVSTLLTKEVWDVEPVVADVMPKGDAVFLSGPDKELGLYAVFYSGNRRVHPTKPGHLPVVINPYALFYLDLVQDDISNLFKTNWLGGLKMDNDTTRAEIQEIVSKYVAEHPEATVVMFCFRRDSPNLISLPDLPTT